MKEEDTTTDLNTKESKISRGAYVAEVAIEYFISIMITGAYLTNLFNNIGFSTAAQTVISLLVTMTFSAELFSVLLINKRSAVKRWVTAWNLFNQLLFAVLTFLYSIVRSFFSVPFGKYAFRNDYLSETAFILHKLRNSHNLSSISI